MSSPVAEHLADRFAADAVALRRRAEALRAAPGRPAGPNAAACLAMADACEQVRQLFAGATSDEAVRALIPTLAGMVAGARTDDVRHVYAGAVSRASEALDGDEDDEDDAEAGDDDEEEYDA
jgi:hypothetical protein